MIPIALIEDNRLVREGMVALLNQTMEVKVVLAVPSGDPELLEDAKPEVVLLDVGLRENDSLHVVETVKTKLPDARVIVMDVLPLDEDIVEFVNVGVSGFILKDATLDSLVSTIRLVAAGAHVLPLQPTSTLFSQIARSAIVRDRAEAMEAVRMTARERAVVDLIGEGLSNKEIAARLNIATHTVKSHVRNVMEKLTLHTRLQIAAYSHKGGRR